MAEYQRFNFKNVENEKQEVVVRHCEYAPWDSHPHSMTAVMLPNRHEITRDVIAKHFAPLWMFFRLLTRKQSS